MSKEDRKERKKQRAREKKARSREKKELLKQKKAEAAQRKKDKAQARKERIKERKARLREESRRSKGLFSKKKRRSRDRSDTADIQAAQTNLSTDNAANTAGAAASAESSAPEESRSKSDHPMADFILKHYPRILLGGGGLMLAGAAIYTLVFFIIDMRSAQVWKEVRTHVVEAPAPAPVQVTTEEEVIPEYHSPYANLFEMNPDMVGWLKIPDTEVDYPVMFTPDDEDHYLNYNFYNEYDHNGCLVLAGPNDMDKPSTNLLIHGHHMRSGAMFGKLADYKDIKYRDEHDEIILYTRYEERHYSVIGAMDARVLGAKEQGFRYYTFFDGENQKDANRYTEEANKYNLYEDREISLDFWGGEQLLTLSTCRGRAGGKDRFVLMCKRTDPPVPIPID